MRGPERAPQLPTLRAPAQPWRSASGQSERPLTPTLRAPAEPWRSASGQSEMTCPDIVPDLITSC